MEPRGCNRWQSAANRSGARTEKQAKTVAVRCDRLPSGVHGKEGVDGSSPSEGSAKAPAIGLCRSGLLVRVAGASADAAGSHAGDELLGGLGEDDYPA